MVPQVHGFMSYDGHTPDFTGTEAPDCRRQGADQQIHLPGLVRQAALHGLPGILSLPGD
jgi:hypothetical protein